MPLTKHLSVYAEPGPKWPEASPLITDQWVPRRWLLWRATTPSSHGQIDTGETSREGLGVIERIGDWVVFFRAQLAEASWRAVLIEWIGRLLPATPSAGAHGLIRTAHALRALADTETSLRVEELGVALAYWAAYYRKLPSTPRLAGTLDLGEALGRVPLFLSGQARPGMPREVYLSVMQGHGEEFSAAVDGAA